MEYYLFSARICVGGKSLIYSSLQATDEGSFDAGWVVETLTRSLAGVYENQEITIKIIFSEKITADQARPFAVRMREIASDAWPVTLS